MGNLLNHAQGFRPVHNIIMVTTKLKPRLFVSGTVKYIRSRNTYSECDRAITQVFDRVRCSATYVMTMVMNMKELASVSCILKVIKFYGGIVLVPLMKFVLCMKITQKFNTNNSKESPSSRSLA